jgi:hypothetical protein
VAWPYVLFHKVYYPNENVDCFHPLRLFPQKAAANPFGKPGSGLQGGGKRGGQEPRQQPQLGQRRLLPQEPKQGRETHLRAEPALSPPLANSSLAPFSFESSPSSHPIYMRAA